jgi:hypothetical protein
MGTAVDPLIAEIRRLHSEKIMVTTKNGPRLYRLQKQTTYTKPPVRTGPQATIITVNSAPPFASCEHMRIEIKCK